MPSTEVEIVRRTAMAALTDVRIASVSAVSGLVGGLLISVAIVDAPLLALTLAAAAGIVVGHATVAGAEQTRTSASETVARVRTGFDADRRRAVSDLLVGIAAGLVLVLVIERQWSSVGLFALAIAVLLTPVGPILLTRTRAIETGALGAAAAFVIGALVEADGARGGILLVALAVGLVLRFATPTTTGPTALLLIVLATVAVIALRPATAGAAEETVTIDGDETPVATGIEVGAGQLLTITVEGTVRFIDGDETSEVEADGGPIYASGCDEFYFCGELLGRIGDSPVFRVGRSLTMVTTAAGELHLWVNDFDLSDNAGSYEATVTIEAAPAATGDGSVTSPVDGAAPVDDPGETSDPNHAASAILGAIGALAGVALGRGSAAVRTAQQ
jgi:hypothetical protein